MGASAVFHARTIAALYDQLTGQRFWRQGIDDLLRWAAPASDAERVLDLGCGPGESAFALARALPTAEVVGIDCAAAMVARARRASARARPGCERVRFEQADAAHLPFAAGGFDLAVGHSFLYLVADPAAVLRETRRVLAPGGLLVLMEPAAGGSLAAALKAARPRILPALRRAPGASLRFAASMMLWRLWSRSAGRLSAARLDALLSAAGFGDVTVAPAFAGLGLRCRGRRGS